MDQMQSSYFSPSTSPNSINSNQHYLLNYTFDNSNNGYSNNSFSNRKSATSPSASIRAALSNAGSQSQSHSQSNPRSASTTSAASATSDDSNGGTRRPSYQEEDEGIILYRPNSGMSNQVLSKLDRRYTNNSINLASAAAAATTSTAAACSTVHSNLDELMSLKSDDGQDQDGDDETGLVPLTGSVSVCSAKDFIDFRSRELLMGHQNHQIHHSASRTQSRLNLNSGVGVDGVSQHGAGAASVTTASSSAHTVV
ncbi:unnamed protein product [Ambrosiozyma monospora]|uniref:Unnamed protein product n=1 Tax=Ambrosiozyma monospora TaxID=43982 RepID=A0ACB5TBQ6_AMBMO|nr:unnamed protein product [Ambrosiozyma monospora]